MRIDGGEPEGYVSGPNSLDCKASTVVLCKQIGDYLEKTYGGWLWAVQPNEFGGVIAIRCLRLHGQYAWMMRIKDIQDDPQLKFVREGAGQMLERFGMKRGPFHLSREALRHAPRDLRGNAVPDVSDKASKVQAKQRAQVLQAAVARGMAKLKQLRQGDETKTIVEVRE